MSRYALVSPQYAFRGWSDMPYALIHRYLFTVIVVPEKFWQICHALDGKSDFDSYAFLPEHRRALDEMIRLGYAVEYEEAREPDIFRSYRAVSSPYLRELHWAITGACNMRCRHCFMESPTNKYQVPVFSDMERILDEVLEAGVAMVSLTGGEPLTYPDLRSLISAITDRGILINEIVTNGLLLTQEFIDFLLKQGQHPIFQISFDGVGLHDQMRGKPGAEAGAINAIRLCRENGLMTAVTSIFSRDNLPSLMDTYELIKSMNVTTWMIGRAQKTGLWKGETDEISVSEMAQVLLMLERRWLEDGRPVHIMMNTFYAALPADAPSTAFHMSYTAESLECVETEERLFLLPDGRLLPCPGFTGTELEKKMPFIGEAPFSTLWSDSALSDFCSETRRARLDVNPDCADCEAFAECGMGCRAYALTEGGNIAGRDPHACEIYRNGWPTRFAELQREWEERYEETGTKKSL